MIRSASIEVEVGSLMGYDSLPSNCSCSTAALLHWFWTRVLYFGRKENAGPGVPCRVFMHGTNPSLLPLLHPRNAGEFAQCGDWVE